MAATVLSDAELLQAARSGDEAAFTELYVRHHAAARRLASTYRRRGDPDDLVNETFEKVLSMLRRGGGPSTSFRAYLFVTLRRLAMEQADRVGPDRLDDVPEPVMAVATAPELDSTERDMVTRAFESLPGRWQAILWHTAVEGRKPRELAGVVGMSANATAALAYRARERLRQAYLQAHLSSRTHPQCEPHRSRLGGYVRDGLSRRDRSATARHLQHCDACRGLVDELGDVNQLLVRSVVPLFLIDAGSTLAAATEPASAGATVAISSAEGGDLLSSAWARVRSLGPIAGAATAAAVATLVLAVTVIPHVTDSGDDSPGSVQVEGSASELEGPGATDRDRPAPPEQAAPSTAGTVETTAEAPPDSATETTPPATDAGSDTLLDLELPGIGVEADVGLDPLEAEAGVDLDLGWVASGAAEGVLTARIVNDGSEALSDLALDVQLSADAQVNNALSSTCGGSQGGLLGAVVGLVRSVTCSLGSVAAGSDAAVDVPVSVKQPGQTATVLLRQAGEVVSSETITLAVG
jgi:RNA polymerase sigma factor (sigma-70 family)